MLEQNLQAVRIVAQHRVHQRGPPKLVPQVNVAEVTASQLQANIPIRYTKRNEFLKKLLNLSLESFLKLHF